MGVYLWLQRLHHASWSGSNDGHIFVIWQSDADLMSFDTWHTTGTIAKIYIHAVGAPEENELLRLFESIEADDIHIRFSR